MDISLAMRRGSLYLHEVVVTSTDPLVSMQKFMVFGFDMRQG